MGLVRLLLDTCTFLWLALQPERLSSGARQCLDDAASELFLSDVSVWEIVLKHAAGRLPLPLRTWVPSRRDFFQLRPLPLMENAVFRRGELPPVHMDRFDRLPAAQALEENFTVLTPDVALGSLGATCRW